MILLDHHITKNDGSLVPYLQLPPLFNLPKSQLQCYGESMYCTVLDLLSKCNSGQSPLDRFVSVVAWSISTTRPATFGVAPYNPILGETHHVSKGNLNVLLEQVLASLFCICLLISSQLYAYILSPMRLNSQIVWLFEPVFI